MIPLRAFFTHFSLALVALFSETERRAGGRDFAFLHDYRCVIAPDREQYWFTVTHKKKNKKKLMSLFFEDSRVLEKQMLCSFSLCVFKSIYSLKCPSEGNFCHCVPVGFPERKAQEFHLRGFMLTGLIWPVFPFYFQSLQIPEAPRIHSRHQMTWEDNKYYRPG